MNSFLIAYDYGAGGLWAVLNANSKDEILKRFPDLNILDEKPASMPAEEYARITAQQTYDLSGPLPQWLAELDRRS